jgi:hypothetical protein
MVDGGKLKVDVPGNQDSSGDRGLAPLFLQDAPQLNSDYEIITQVTLTAGSGSAGLVVTDGITGVPAFSLQFFRASSFITQIQTISGDEVLNTQVRFSATSVFLRIQRDLFADEETPQVSAVDETVDSIRDRFGKSSVNRARTLDPGQIR